MAGRPLSPAYGITATHAACETASFLDMRGAVLVAQGIDQDRTSLVAVRPRMRTLQRAAEMLGRKVRLDLSERVAAAAPGQVDVCVSKHKGSGGAI